MKKQRAVFLGTPDFSVPTLQTLHQHPEIELVKVISMPDRPAGRGQQLKSPPVIEYAKKHNLSFFQTENINKQTELIEELEDLKVDFFLVLAFAQFLGKRVLNIASKGAFNIHTSLLPKYRGAAPIQYALLNGDDKTGVSIQKMVKKMDAGDIVYAREVAIKSDETGGELWLKLQHLAAECSHHFLDQLIEDKLKYEPQNEDHVSFAPSIKKEDGFLDFKNKKSDEIINRIRAFDPWPGTYCFIDHNRVKIFTVKKNSISIAPGKLKKKENQLFVGTQDGSLEILEWQLAGKKRSFTKDIINGYRGELEITTK